MLDYRSIKSSNYLAEKAQLSANEMETTTKAMHEIARDTKRETVSMRIITLVTLFFLPGTFISVSHLEESLCTLLIVAIDAHEH